MVNHCFLQPLESALQRVCHIYTATATQTTRMSYFISSICYLQLFKNKYNHLILIYSVNILTAQPNVGWHYHVNLI